MSNSAQLNFISISDNYQHFYNLQNLPKEKKTTKNITFHPKSSLRLISSMNCSLFSFITEYIKLDVFHIKIPQMELNQALLLFVQCVFVYP